jgi:large subunit ribosomal protein L32e
METKKNKKPKFLRRGWSRYSKLGHKRKNKQVWRRPSGRDNKMRDKRRGYPAVVSVGFKRDKKLRNTYEGKILILVNNVKDLEKLQKNEVVLIGKIGKKKKLEVIKAAHEKKLEIHKMNSEKFLKQNLKQTKSEETKTGEKKK